MMNDGGGRVPVFEKKEKSYIQIAKYLFFSTPVACYLVIKMLNAS